MGRNNFFRRAGRAVGAVASTMVHHPLKAAPIIASCFVPQLAPSVALSLGISTTTAVIAMSATVGAASAVSSHQNVIKAALAGAVTGGLGCAAAPLSIVQSVAINTGAGAISSTITGNNVLAGAVGGGVGAAVSQSLPVTTTTTPMTTQVTKSVVVSTASGAASGVITGKLPESIGTSLVIGTISGVTSTLKTPESQHKSGMDWPKKELIPKESSKQTVISKSELDSKPAVLSSTPATNPIPTGTIQTQRNPSQETLYKSIDGSLCNSRDITKATTWDNVTDVIPLPFAPQGINLGCSVKNLDTRVGDKPEPPKSVIRQILESSISHEEYGKQRANLP